MGPKCRHRLRVHKVSRLQLKNIGAMKENILNGMNAMVKRALDDELIKKNNKEVAKSIATINQAEDVRDLIFSQFPCWQIQIDHFLIFFSLAQKKRQRLSFCGNRRG